MKIKINDLYSCSMSEESTAYFMYSSPVFQHIVVLVGVQILYDNRQDLLSFYKTIK